MTWGEKEEEEEREEERETGVERRERERERRKSIGALIFLLCGGTERACRPRRNEWKGRESRASLRKRGNGMTEGEREGERE